MKLLRDYWLALFHYERDLAEQIRKANPGARVQPARNQDFQAAEMVMHLAETVIMPTETMMQLVQNIDRLDCVGHLHLPYPHLLVQFTHPISEGELLPFVEVSHHQEQFGILSDSVTGLMISNAHQDPELAHIPSRHLKIAAMALFESTAINRVAWRATETKSVPWWESTRGEIARHIAPGPMSNKVRMLQLSYLVDLFLNAPNVIVVRQVPDPHVQAKRVRKGKDRLPEYHTVTIEKVQVVYPPHPLSKGSPHDHMYPVRGHFRRIKGHDSPAWIPNHFRGVRHGIDTLRKEAYKYQPPRTKTDG
jgi:hypothetical protein